MAQTTIAHAWVGDLNPAFNPLKIIMDSTNKNASGFRYIFDVYLAGTATKIAEIKPMPRFGDGYGEDDLSKVLQSQVSHNFTPSLTNSQHATNSYVNFDVKVGEEYVSPINYTASLTQNGVFVKITATHTFVANDQVIVTQTDGGVANPLIEGLFTVVEVTGTTDFTITALWVNVNDATINGAVNYADDRKTIFRDITTLSDYKAFNGAMTFKGFTTYSPNDYDLTSSTDEFLINIPDNFRIRPTSHLWANIFNDETACNVIFENDGGDVFTYVVSSSNIVSQITLAHPDIDSTLTVSSGTAGLIKDDTEYYDVYIEIGGLVKSKGYRIYIDRRCAINDYEICFLDRMGGIGSFSFQLKDELNGTVKKTTYNKHIEGSVSSQRWNYSTDETGMNSVNISVEEELTLNTNYMTEAESDYFAELVSSPNTWLRIGDDFYGCTISDTSYKKDRANVKRLIKKTLKVKLSVQNIING